MDEFEFKLAKTIAIVFVLIAAGIQVGAAAVYWCGP